LASDHLKSGTHALALGESILNGTTAVVHVCSAQSALLDPERKDLSPDTSDCEYIFRLWLPVILAIVLGAVLLAPCLCAHDTRSAASAWGLQSRVELSLLPASRNHPFTQGCYICGSRSARYDCVHSFQSMSCKNADIPCELILCMQLLCMQLTCLLLRWPATTYNTNLCKTSTSGACIFFLLLVVFSRFHWWCTATRTKACHYTEQESNVRTFVLEIADMHACKLKVAKMKNVVFFSSFYVCLLCM
jgi:hypothetical protein